MTMAFFPPFRFFNLPAFLVEDVSGGSKLDSASFDWMGSGQGPLPGSASYMAPELKRQVGTRNAWGNAADWIHRMG